MATLSAKRREAEPPLSGGGEQQGDTLGVSIRTRRDATTKTLRPQSNPAQAKARAQSETETGHQQLTARKITQAETHAGANVDPAPWVRQQSERKSCPPMLWHGALESLRWDLELDGAPKGAPGQLQRVYFLVLALTASSLFLTCDASLRRLQAALARSSFPPLSPLPHASFLPLPSSPTVPCFPHKPLRVLTKARLTVSSLLCGGSAPTARLVGQW